MSTNSVYEIRVENLLRLIEQYDTQEELQSLTGIASSTFSRVKNWTPEQDNPNYKRMGEKLARRIETSLELPMHWMDTNHSAEASSSPYALVAMPRNKGAPSSTPNMTKLSSIQTATRDTLVKLMVAGKLPDTACLKLLQTWQSAVEELETLPL